MSNNRARSKSKQVNHPEAYKPLPPKNDLSRIKQRERANPWTAQQNPRLTPNHEDARPSPQMTPNRQERQQQPTPPISHQQQGQRGQQQGSGLSDPRLNRRPNPNVIRVNAPNPVPPPISSTPRPPQQSRPQNLQAPVQQNRNNNTATKSSRSVANSTPMPNQQKENRNAVQFGQVGQAARTPANFQAAQQNRNNNNTTNPSKSVPGIAFAACRPTPSEAYTAKENQAGPTPSPRVQSGRTSPFGHGRGGQAVQPVRASQNFQTAQQHKTNNNTTKPSKSAAAGCLVPRSTTPNQAFSTETATKENQAAFGRERGLTQPALYDSQIRSGPREGQAVHAEQQQQHIPVRVTTTLNCPAQPGAASAELPAQFDPTRPPPPIPPLSAVRFFNNYNWSRTNPGECAGGGQRVGGQRSFVQSSGPSPAMGFRSNLDNSSANRQRQQKPSHIDTANREFGNATHGRQPTVERQLPPQRSVGDHRLELEADEPAVVVAADSVEFLESNSTPRPRKRANPEAPNEVGQKRVRTSTTPTRATPPNQTPPVDRLENLVQLAEEIDTYAIETEERDQMTQRVCDLFMEMKEGFEKQLAMRRK